MKHLSFSTRTHCSSVLYFKHSTKFTTRVATWAVRNSGKQVTIDKLHFDKTLLRYTDYHFDNEKRKDLNEKQQEESRDTFLIVINNFDLQFPLFTLNVRG